MSDERTVEDVVLDAVGGWYSEEIGAPKLMQGLGLNSDMPVARLRADLEIAKRARETERQTVTGPSRFAGRDIGYVEGFNACLDHILGSTT